MPQFRPYSNLADGQVFRDENGVAIEVFNPDVTTIAPADGDSLVYVAANNNWVPGSGGGGGGSLQIREQAHDSSHSTGAYEWICPEGVTDIQLSMAGCGGVGGTGGGSRGGGGGGGAGGYLIDESIVGLVGGETYTISIPAGSTGSGLNATISGTFYGTASSQISCLGGGAGGIGTAIFPLPFLGGAGGTGGAVGGVRVNGGFANITTGGAGGGGGAAAGGQNGNLIWKNDLANVITAVGGGTGPFGGGGGGGSSRASGGNGSSDPGTGGAGGGAGGWLIGGAASGTTAGTGGDSGIRIAFIGASTDGLITEA